MLQSSESENEILLGNKQLAGIFIVVALLLGVAFTAGYMVGRNGGLKKPVETAAGVPAQAVEPAAAPASPGTGGQTHTVGSDDGGPIHSAPLKAAPTQEPSSPPLGARHVETNPPATGEGESYSPRSGAKYLQVAAVSKDEAQAVADVLHKKGFRAHAVPKPGNAKIFRVIIGPVKDAGDLSSTRDALRKTGFREVIVQTY